MVPRNTPEPIVQQMHQAIVTMLKDPQVREHLEAQTTVPSAVMTLGEAARYFDAETARYRAIAKTIDLQPQ